MATTAELLSALRKADAAGNVEDARRLAQLVRQQSAAPEVLPEIAPEEKPETTLGGQIKEGLKGLLPGAVGLVESAAVGASALLPEETEKAAREKIKEYAEAAKKPFEAAPGYEDTVGRKLGEAIGSTVPFLAAGPLGLAGRAAAVGLGVGAGAGEARLRAEGEGVTPEERGTATALGIAPGLLEVFPPFRILGRLDKEVVETGVDVVRRALVAGGEEAAQEAASGFAQNLIAKGVYKPEQELIEGLGEQAAYGGATGAIVQGLLDMATGRRARRSTTKDIKDEEIRGTVEEMAAARETEPVAAPEEDMGEVRVGGAEERAAGDVAGGVEPGVPVSPGRGEPAPVTGEVEPGRVGDDRGGVAGIAERTGEVDRTLEPTLETKETTQAPEPEQEEVPPVPFNLQELIPATIDKDAAKTYEIIKSSKRGRASKFKPLVEEVEATAQKVADYIQQQGFDPNNLAEIKSAPQEVQDAAKVLSNLALTARNIARTANQEFRLTSSTTIKGKAEGVQQDAAQKAEALIQKNAEDVAQSVKVANDFLAEPQAGADSLVFSRQAEPQARGMTKADATKTQEAIMEGWENVPAVEVVQSIEELPADIQEEIRKQGVNPKGMYNIPRRKVFLVADNLVNNNDAILTVVHETIGHFGVREILGDRYNAVMDQIYNGNSDVKKRADAYLEGNPKVTRQIATEEVLAEMAEESLGKFQAKKRIEIPKPLRQFIQAVRRALSKIPMLKMNAVSDTDIMELLANSSRFVRRGAMKYDRFTKGVSAKKAAPAINETLLNKVVKQDARLSDKRIGQLLSSYGYLGENSTNAYIGFVRPKDFLEATTTPDELAYMREREFTQLNKEKLAGEVQPIFLNIKRQSEDFGAPMATSSDIVGHEGRHRMMALQAAGVEEVPVVFVNGLGSGYMGYEIINPKVIDRIDLGGQRWEGVGEGNGFTAYNLIPISYEYRNQIKETFGGDAEVVFSFKNRAGAGKVAPINSMSKAVPIWEKVKDTLSLSKLKAWSPTGKEYLFKTFTLRMLSDVAGDALTNLKGAIKVTEQMSTTRNQIMKDGGEIQSELMDLNKKDPDQLRLLGELSVEATRLGIDPDPLAKDKNASALLDKAWKLMSPDAQKLYRKMRDFYAKQVDDMVNDMKARVLQNEKADPAKAKEIIDAIEAEFGADKRIKPYFPLRRFGRYWFQIGKGNDKEFYLFESPGERDYWMRERERELREANREDLIDDMKSGNNLREGSDAFHNAAGTLPLMKKVEEIVDGIEFDAKDPAKAKEDLKDAVKQLTYLLLPQNNIRKAFIHRKGIQGASTDIARIFSSSVVNIAYQRARVKHGGDFASAVNATFGELEGMPAGDQRDTLEAIAFELDSRTDHILGTEPTTTAHRAANFATQTTFLWLLTSPASALINVFGGVAIGMPYIGARYGFDKAAGKLASYAKKYAKTGAKFKEGSTVFPTLEKATDLSDLQKQAYARFAHDNAIDVTLQHDLAGMAERPTELYTGTKAKVIQAVSALFHNSERAMRETLLMTAFDLAYDKAKTSYKMTDEQAFEFAIQDAKDLVMMSVGDFTRASKPPIFTGPVTKIMFQFKQYSLLMTYNILRNAAVGFKPKAGATKEELAAAKEARRRTYGTLGMTALFAGAKGMPIFSATMMMIEMLSMLGDDDEEIENGEAWLYGYLEDAIGSKAAQAIMRGPLPQVSNVGLSERMSLDLMDLWFRDSGYQPTSEDALKEYLVQFMGPTIGLAVNAARAKDLLDNYQGDRALEAISPSIMRNLMIANRYAKEGVQTARGITIDEDVDYLDLFVKSLGFTPEDVLQKQRAVIQRKGAASGIEAKRSKLLGIMYNATLRGDDDLYDLGIEKIIEFNDKYPEMAIDMDTIDNSIKRRMEDKYLQEALGGVSKKLYPRLIEDFRQPE